MSCAWRAGVPCELAADRAPSPACSDVGAAHRALFIPGTALTWIFYSASLFTERYLRHIRRIPGSMRKRETTWDIIACIFGFCGGLALMLLSILDAFNHSTAHWILTAVFVVCIVISAAFQTSEVMMLERDHVERRHLRRNAIIKLVIVSVAIAGAVCFGGTYGGSSSKYCPSGEAPTTHCNVIGSVAAAFEWVSLAAYQVLRPPRCPAADPCPPARHSSSPCCSTSTCSRSCSTCGRRTRRSATRSTTP